MKDKSLIASLIGFFICLEIVVGLNHVVLSYWEWFLVAAAASFGGRAIAYMTIGLPIRGLFVKVTAHPHGIGAWTEPKYEQGWKKAVGELLSCPLCSGTWVAACLLVVWNFFPETAYSMTQLLSIASLAAFVSRAHESLEQSAVNNAEQACYYRSKCDNKNQEIGE